MSTQTNAQRLAAKMKSYKLASGYAWHCHKAGDELLRLDKIEAEWAALSQDEGKAQREIERLEAANEELMNALKMNAQALSWLSFGECRGFTDNLPTALEATGAASAAIKKHGGAA